MAVSSIKDRLPKGDTLFINNIMITQKELKEALIYDQELGVFTYLENGRIVKKGSVAGSISGEGYRYIHVGRGSVSAHRLAWLYVHGEFPEDQIDHINHVRDDNRLCNLRAVTFHENRMNTSLRSDNKSGVSGVSWAKTKNKWGANIRYKSKRINLGYFSDIKDAVIARNNGKIKYNFHPNHS